MRTLLVGMVGGLAALVGFAGAASANTVNLVFQGSGTNTTGGITPVATSSNVVLDVVLDGGPDTLGGGVTVDYGNTGKVTFVSVLLDPTNAFQGGAGTVTDTGTQVRNINGLNPFGPVAQPVVLGAITFHKEAVSGDALFQTLYTATDTLDQVGDQPGDFGTAKLINAPEPGALSLLAMGFGGLILGRNRKS